MSTRGPSCPAVDVRTVFDWRRESGILISGKFRAIHPRGKSAQEAERYIRDFMRDIYAGCHPIGPADFEFRQSNPLCWTRKHLVKR